MSWIQPRFNGFDFMTHDYFVRGPEPTGLNLKPFVSMRHVVLLYTP